MLLTCEALLVFNVACSQIALGTVAVVGRSICFLCSTCLEKRICACNYHSYWSYRSMFSCLYQLSAAFRKMDADGDGCVNAADVDIFFATNTIPDAPTGESEVHIHRIDCNHVIV